MDWMAPLTGAVRPPAWRGPAALYLKLSSGDEAEEADEDLEPEQTTGDGGIPAFRDCSVCGCRLPLTREFFYFKKRNKHGFMPECIGCHNGRHTTKGKK
jgi:hypothetical protein